MSPLYRPIGADAEERDDGTHPTVNETIDVSVSKRWRADPAYSASLDYGKWRPGGTESDLRR
ncbi:hypothetical protein ACVMAJ_000186 [Bradyrhizobium sp. USDA 4448]